MPQEGDTLENKEKLDGVVDKVDGKMGTVDRDQENRDKCRVLREKTVSTVEIRKARARINNHKYAYNFLIQFISDYCNNSLNDVRTMLNIL